MDILGALAQYGKFVPWLVAGFFLYAFLLYQVLFKPVVKLLAERERRSKEAGDLTARSAHDLKERTAEYEAAVLDAKKRGAAVRAGLRDEAARFRAEQLAAAREEAKKILDEGGIQLDKDLTGIRADLERQAQAFATDMMDRILSGRGAA